MYYNYLVRGVEFVFSLGLFVNAILFIPQIFEVYRTKNSRGLSIFTFMGFNVIQLFTVLHAYIHGDVILFWGYLLSLITCGAVTILIIFYRPKFDKKIFRKG